MKKIFLSAFFLLSISCFAQNKESLYAKDSLATVPPTNTKRSVPIEKKQDVAYASTTSIEHAPFDQAKEFAGLGIAAFCFSGVAFILLSDHVAIEKHPDNVKFYSAISGGGIIVGGILEGVAILKLAKSIHFLQNRSLSLNATPAGVSLCYKF